MIVAGIIVASLLYAAEEEEDGKLQVTATFYPLAFYAGEIGGEHVTVETLIPANSEIHSWQPSTSDIVKVDDSDVLVYNGGGADHWFEDDILPSISTGNKVVIESTDGLELLVKGEEGHDHGDEGHDHGDEDFDPHTWISPYMALGQAENIYKGLIEADPEHETEYKENWLDLKQQLEALDSSYSQNLSTKNKSLIFTNHAAFGYLAHRYDFQQEGVIGLSADEQPSASTIANLADHMEEEGIFTIFVDPVYSDNYAQTLKNEVEDQTGQTVTVLELYFMLGKIDGMDLFQQMESNLEQLKIGLEA